MFRFTLLLFWFYIFPVVKTLKFPIPTGQEMRHSFRGRDRYSMLGSMPSTSF